MAGEKCKNSNRPSQPSPERRRIVAIFHSVNRPKTAMADDAAQMDLKTILSTAKVGELTFGVRPRLTPTDTVAAAAAEMRNQSHGSAVICENGQLVGIFTERDLLKVIASGSGLDIPLSDVMTPNPKLTSVDDSLLDAIRSMDTGGYRRLPVVDSSGAPVGIVDVKTVVHFLVGHFPAAVYNQASHAQLIARSREGA
jgi:predicted transcriptional regulator